MDDREILDHLRSTAARMDLTAEAGETGDWVRVELGLREIHERSAALLQEIGIKRLSEMRPENRARKAG